jgi:hypothetical protein
VAFARAYGARKERKSVEVFVRFAHKNLNTFSLYERRRREEKPRRVIFVKPCTASF